MADLCQVWQQLTAVLKSKLPTPAYSALVHCMTLVETNERELTVQVESTFHRDVLLKQHRDVFLEACQQVVGRRVQLCVRIAASQGANNIINNININSSRNINSREFNTPVEKNINTINRNYKGLYAKIHSDAAFLEAQSWKVDAPFLYAAVRDFGEYPVKEIIARLRRLADSYFRQGQPIPQQRGRLFNVEIHKLRKQRLAS
jgi:hypothetical protein